MYRSDIDGNVQGMTWFPYVRFLGCLVHLISDIFDMTHGNIFKELKSKGHKIYMGMMKYDNMRVERALFLTADLRL